MKLKDLKKTKMNKPLRYVIYGQEGVGKSTLASGCKNAIWIDVEDGTSSLDICRIPFKGGVASSLAHVIEALTAVRDEDHGFNELVIDTIDRLEALVWQHVCDKSGGKHSTIESFGYGKGYVIALSEWRRICALLDSIRTTKNMSIVLIAHSHIRTFRNPEGEDYDRYQLRLNDKAAGLIKEWADIVAFMKFEEGASKLPGESRSKGFNTGKRFVYTQRQAAFDAKTRIAIPSEIEIKGPESWASLTTEKTQNKNPF